MNKTTLFILLILIILSGCNSKMTVYKGYDEENEKWRDAGGIPFKMTEAVVKTGYRYTHTKAGSTCIPSRFIEVVALPIGETFYVNVDMGQFADGGLTFKANSNGTVQEISMSSKPDSSAIDSFTGALSNLLPFAGILPKVVAEPEPDSTTGNTSTSLKAAKAEIPSCNSGEANVVFLPFQKSLQYNEEKINEQIESMNEKIKENSNSAPAVATDN